MSTIFISYRRADAATEAQLIAKQMRGRYGEESVFFDIHSILKGVDFQKKIDASVSKCDVLLAVIGKDWIDAQFEEGERQGQRRLDDPQDFVRIEVASALKREIPVIPVLIGKVSMSDLQNKLPSDLSDLSKRNAAWVRPGSDLEHDLQSLVVDVRKVTNLKPLTPDELSLPSGVSVIPKGLRAFDEDDAGFFLSLLPGPRRDGGLPESIYFWKTRIDETDADKTFKVGLLYGPSGCGKSSLVKAGLIPHLSDQVTPVYVEATATDTEKRLLAKLKKHCPYLSSKESLRATLRQKDEITAGKKVLIVLDQFEQFLHSTPFDEQRPLIDALKECDGERLQCIVMVRDDFIMATTRFLNALGIQLAQDENYAFVDLFDKRHAKKVLAMFGQAFDKLPKSGEFAKEQNDFLNQAVSELLEEDFVICVRLALFAQMVRAKEWTSKTFKSFGGAKGVGKLFLEESFTAKTAPLENRRHQSAARKVLNVLLPEHGSDIKGAMRSKQELLEQSGYARRPADFEELLTILDTNLRLITPTEAVAVESEDAQPAEDAAGEKYYQLTHDYLVSSLREWLTQEQEKTRRGRAEIRLAKRSALWNAEPERRHLPAWWEHINIRLLTRRKNWTAPQKTMMYAATWHHGALGSALLVALVLLTWSGYQITGRLAAKNLVNDLKSAGDAEAASRINKLSSYSRFVVPILKDEIDRPPPDRKPSSKLSDESREHFEHRARFAAALLNLGHAEEMLPLLKHTPDPTEQTHYIAHIN